MPNETKSLRLRANISTSVKGQPSNLARFLKYVVKNKETGCWEWTGSIMSAGYGQFSTGRLRNNRAHRWFYIQMRGTIPGNAYLDHLCRNKICVNPDHLEPASAQTNVLRGISPPAVNAKKQTCKRGHTLTPANTWKSKQGYRQCRICMAIRRRLYQIGVRNRFNARGLAYPETWKVNESEVRREFATVVKENNGRKA